MLGILSDTFYRGITIFEENLRLESIKLIQGGIGKINDILTLPLYMTMFL